MSSLINNAMSGLNAAQAALNTASNNISSYNVAGYTRQTTGSAPGADWEIRRVGESV